MVDKDPDLDLKKRARRRLVGAIALAFLAAIVLPMVMDQTPPASVQPVELRIPGQETLVARPQEAPAPNPAVVGKAESVIPDAADFASVNGDVGGNEVSKATAEAASQNRLPPPVAADKPLVKSPVAKETPVKPAAVAVKDAPNDRDLALQAQKESARARAILAGQAQTTSAPGDPHVILIGAFSNPGNVKTLQTKLGELGIKVYTEKLNSPQGEKTRVRAGPFPSREAADKALARMKRIGVDGVVAPRS